jgi:hypothetical protein
MASATKEKVAKALAEVKKLNEDFEFNIFESGDFLKLLETTNTQQGDSPKTDEEDEQPQPDDENEPDIEDEPDEEEEDSSSKKKDKEKDKDTDNKDDKDDKDDDDKKKKPKKRELRVGDKVRVKSTGREGVITAINDDGTYVVSDDGAEFDEGGEIEQVFEVVGEIGTYAEDELEAVSEEEDTGDDDGGDDDGEDEDPDAPENPNKKGKKKKKKKKDPDDPDPDDEDPFLKDPDDYDDPDDDADPDPDAPPRPPKPVDIDEIRRKFRKIRTHTFKLPLFAKTFFNADLNSSLFYDEQSPMVLFNRASKDVLNPKKNMSLEDASKVMNFNINYIQSHVPFLRQYLHYVPDANEQMVYMINPQKRFEFPPEIAGILSLELIEQMLDMNDPDALHLAIPTLLLLEKIIINDNFYYRIFSLSAVLNPEYFSQNYLKPHLDFLRKYFYTKYLTFCTQENIFTEVEVTDTMMYDTASSPSLSVFSSGNNLLVINAIGSDIFDEDYILYVCRNIISMNGDSLQIDRIFLKDATENDRLVLVRNLYSFYIYSVNLKSNSNVKKTILRNMKKFGTLQSKSYDNFLIDIQTLIFRI